MKTSGMNTLTTFPSIVAPILATAAILAFTAGLPATAIVSIGLLLLAFRFSSADFGKITLVGIFALGLSVLFSALAYAVLGMATAPNGGPLAFLLMVLLFFGLAFMAGWLMVYIVGRFGRGAHAPMP